MKYMAISIMLFIFPTLAHAGKKIDETLEVSATANIRIEDLSSRMEIHAWDKNLFKVSGEISDKAKDYTMEKDGIGASFEVEYENRRDWRGKFNAKDSSNLKFYVPVKSRVEVINVTGEIIVSGIEGGTIVESVDAEVRVENLKGRISIETVNGNIRTNNLAGKVDIESVNGTIDDEDSSGELSISTVQGNISSNSRYSTVELENVNGGVNLQLDKIDELSIDSVNGKIEVALDLSKNGEISISNVNGSIDLKLNSDVSADFNVEAFVGGAIVNRLTTDKVDRKEFGLGRSLDFSKDGGNGRVEISTVSGKISIGPR